MIGTSRANVRWPTRYHFLRALSRGEGLEELRVRDEGHGFDVFGANADWVRLGAGLTRFLYERWFRVLSHGGENIPSAGPAILAANHGGALPFDGAMVWADVLRQTRPPRLARPIEDNFVPLLPFASTLFHRAGAVGGSRGNVRRLLDDGELLLIFPEGTEGIGKPFKERYRLRPFRVGHVELAIRHRAPVIPVGVVGAEEQLPQLAKIEWGVQAFGIPHVPITASPFPLPVRYRIRYGPQIRFDLPPEAADDPKAVFAARDRVQGEVDRLISEGLAERRGRWFA
ncbi:MAG: acyltransferase family protein [Deltaproteobacteria bacterium]|nr:acyltransferase family protein [Deltaproteobacteria bacterium]